MTSHETQRAAIVTGGAHGIGAAIAQRLARDGFAAIVNYSQGDEQARTTVSKIEAAGGRAIAVKADVSDPDSVKRLFDAAEEAYGGVDVIFNNVGVMSLSPISRATDDEFDNTIAVNLKGVFNGLREAARRLRRGGSIVSVSSSVVGLYQPNYALYAASKAGIEAMTHIVAKELGARGITVNAVAPGPVQTPLFTKGKKTEQIEAIKKMNPFGRLGDPEDIARAIAFLVEPDGRWISGQLLRANGGVV